jgi:hypothetical protein
MRNWINLLENAVPSFVERVTDDLLDDILTTGKWVHHGADIEEQWDQGSFDGYIDSSFEGKPFEEVRHTPEFRKALHDILMMMANQQYENLTQGSKYDDLPPLGPNTKLYRGISLKGGINDSVGVYWSQLKSQSLHRFISEEVGSGFLFVAEVKDVTIDWEATIRSRLDYSNGGDEHEIQLKKGTPVKCRAFNVHFSNGRPVVTNGTYILKKA